MCTEHRPIVADGRGTPVSKEFDGLGLEKLAAAYHCREHAHIVRSDLRELIAIGILTCLIGFGMAFTNPVRGVALFFVGVGVIAAVYVGHKRRRAAALTARPLLPLIPNLDSVSIRESLHGDITLGEDGRYISLPGQVTGHVDVVMTLAKADRDRLERYRGRYRLSTGDPIGFSAGYGLIQGQVGLTLEPQPGQSARPLPGGMGIAFKGEVAGNPLFSSGDSWNAGQHPGRWAISFPYTLDRERSPARTPIWLVPSLIPASDHQTLEVDVQWVRFGDKNRPLKLDRLELVELQVPKGWGNIDMVTPNAFIRDSPSEPTRTIQWKQLPPPRSLKQSSRTLTIHFEKRVRQSDKLTGQLLASFVGSLSGAEGMSIYRALGDKWPTPPKPIVKTEVSVDFELSLSSIRYHNVRVVPERNNDQDSDRREVENFPGVVPDYRTVIALTDALSAEGYYVKRVIENAPRGGGRAELFNRYWDLGGRRYDGVFPIDFHITLTGEEEHGIGIHPTGGGTSARITVQGSYVNPNMKIQIENEWDTLHNMVEEKLNERWLAVPAQENGHRQSASAQWDLYGE